MAPGDRPGPVGGQLDDAQPGERRRIGRRGPGRRRCGSLRELAPNRLRVLAEPRRRSAAARGCAGQLVSGPGKAQLAQLGILVRLPPLARRQLHVAIQPRRVEHRGACHAQFLRAGRHLFGVVLLRPVLHIAVDAGDRLPPGVNVIGIDLVDPLRLINQQKDVRVGNHLHKMRPAVARPGEIVPGSRQQLAAGDPRRHQPGVGGEVGLELRQFDPLPVPRAPPLAQRSQHRQRAVDARVDFALAARNQQRLAIGLAGEIHVPAHRPGGDIAAAPVGAGAGAPPRREIRADQARLRSCGQISLPLGAAVGQ